MTVQDEGWRDSARGQLHLIWAVPAVVVTIGITLGAGLLYLGFISR